MSRTTLVIAALLCPLFLHASMSVRYTVDSRTAVKTDGEAPLGSYAEYQQGGSRKCQLTKGASATLVIYGFAGYYIETVSLEMRSNQSSGAGALTMTIGDKQVWNIEDAPFSDTQWHGDWSGDYVPVVHKITPRQMVDVDQTVSITIAASENSLYIASYTITYGEAPTECFTVSFDTHTDVSLPPLRESSPGEGVTLPEGSDYADTWFFLGWTEQQIAHTEDKPDFYQATEQYFPSENTVLNAVYSNRPNTAAGNYILQATEPEDGLYLIGSTRMDGLMCGSSSSQNLGFYAAPTTQTDPESGLYRLPATDYHSGCYYLLLFDTSETDSLVSIYNIQDDEYVAPPKEGSTAFRKVDELWNYRLLPDFTIVFYHHYYEYTRVLYSTFAMSGEDYYDCFRADKFKLESFHDHGLSLFPYMGETGPQVFTSFPLGDATDDLTAPSPLRVENGIVSNPQRLQVSVFDLAGRLLLTTADDTFPLPAQSGTYLFCTSDRQVLKVIK